MKNDSISRQDAIDALGGEITVTGRANAEAVRGYARLVADRLKRLPSAQPDFDMTEKIDKAHDDGYEQGYLQGKADYERKNGKWIPQDYNQRYGNISTTVYYYPKCSVCGCSGDYTDAFCKSCGADMRGDAE